MKGRPVVPEFRSTNPLVTAIDLAVLEARWLADAALTRFPTRLRKQAARHGRGRKCAST